MGNKLGVGPLRAIFPGPIFPPAGGSVFAYRTRSRRAVLVSVALVSRKK
jgi:hypothetical protein